jgi:hypothetical protein
MPRTRVPPSPRPALRTGEKQRAESGTGEAARRGIGDASSAFVTERDDAMLRFLRAARALVARPEEWLPRGYASDSEGDWVPVGSPVAVRFSLSGALLRAGKGSKELLSAAREIFRERSAESYARILGSEGTHADVLNLLDAAMASVARDGERRVRSHSGVQSRVVEPPTRSGTAAKIDEKSRTK